MQSAVLVISGYKKYQSGYFLNPVFQELCSVNECLLKLFERIYGKDLRTWSIVYPRAECKKNN